MNISSCPLATTSDTELIKDTIEFYLENEDKWAFDPYVGANGSCVYLMADGRRCAVGRMVTQEMAEKLQKLRGSVEALVVKDTLFSEFSEFGFDGRKHSVIASLQRWHDNIALELINIERGESYFTVPQVFQKAFDNIQNALIAAASGPNVEIFIGTFEYPFE